MRARERRGSPPPSPDIVLRLSQKGSLKRANFSGANAEGVSFFGCDLQGALFNGANLRNANMGQARARPPPRPPSPSLIHTRCRPHLTPHVAPPPPKANLAGADLRDADLTGAILSSARLDGALTEGADFSDVILRKDAVTKARGQAAGRRRGVVRGHHSGCLAQGLALRRR